MVFTPFLPLAGPLAFGQSSLWNANLQRRGLVKVKGTEICFVDGSSKWLHSALEGLQTYFWSEVVYSFISQESPWTVNYSFFEEVSGGGNRWWGNFLISLGRFVTSRELGTRTSFLQRVRCVDRGLSSCSNVSQQSNWGAEKAAVPWNCQGAFLLRCHVRYKRLQSWTLKHLWRLALGF